MCRLSHGDLNSAKTFVEQNHHFVAIQMKGLILAISTKLQRSQVTMIKQMKQMIVGLVTLLAFSTSIDAIEDMIQYHHKVASKTGREDVVDGLLHHSQIKNDFFRELLEDGTHGWITTMSFYTGSPDTTPPSTYPQGKQQYPTISPSKNWIPVASMSPTRSQQGKFSFKPTFSQKTKQPALPPFLSYKPVNADILPTAQPNTKSTSTLPTHHPSDFSSYGPMTTRSPQSDTEGENRHTQTPTQIPTAIETSMQPSALHSANQPPTSQESEVFDCNFNNVITIAKPPTNSITTLRFQVGYAIESTANQTEYIERVERQIMITALAGALQCETGGVFFANLTAGATGRSKEILGIPFNTTSNNDTCEASISTCTVFETQFHVAVNKILDPEIAAFLGYVMLKENMDDGTFVQNIPTIDRCEYLKPLPLLPPMTQSNNTSKEENQSTERLSVSPWSLTAVSAMCKSASITSTCHR
jgi:hypothetical protein